LLSFCSCGNIKSDKPHYAADTYNYQRYCGKTIFYIDYQRYGGQSGDYLTIYFNDKTRLRIYAYKYTMQIYD